MNQDFSKRFAIVVRHDLEPWQITNVIAHIAAKLGRVVEQFDTGDYFTMKDGFSMPRNSQYPIIVLRVGFSRDLQALLAAVQAAQLPYLAFVREMLDFNEDEKLQEALSKKDASEVEYLGIGMFGENQEVKQLTKGFDLWK
ncbi:DUF2000 family protein [Candidatus Kaiserbacteria bacterium]|nr:DUF2000 family protein [Candidatus Kaiserbacteria bacterium]